MTHIPNNYSQIEKDTFREVFDELYRKSSDNCVLSYFGEVDSKKVNEIIQSVENSLEEQKATTRLTKKVFTVFVEGLQNIRLHGETNTKGDKMGFLLLSKKESGFHISIGNLIDINYKEWVNKKLSDITKLSKPRLKEYYLEILSKGIISKKGGAGLGLITMALKSSSPLCCSFRNIDDRLSSFTLNLEIVLK